MDSFDLSLGDLPDFSGFTQDAETRDAIDDALLVPSVGARCSFVVVVFAINRVVFEQKSAVKDQVGVVFDGYVFFEGPSLVVVILTSIFCTRIRIDGGGSMDVVSIYRPV
jgi:hypothetical protein